jgi:hypothetical protein
VAEGNDAGQVTNILTHTPAGQPTWQSQHPDKQTLPNHVQDVIRALMISPYHRPNAAPLGVRENVNTTQQLGPPRM